MADEVKKKPKADEKPVAVPEAPPAAAVEAPKPKARVVGQRDRADRETGEVRFKLRATSHSGSPWVYLIASGDDVEAAKAAYTEYAQIKSGEKVEFHVTKLPD